MGAGRKGNKTQEVQTKKPSLSERKTGLNDTILFQLLRDIQFKSFGQIITEDSPTPSERNRAEQGGRFT